MAAQNIIDIGYDIGKFTDQTATVVEGLKEVKDAVQELPPEFKKVLDGYVAAMDTKIKPGSTGGITELKAQITALDVQMKKLQVDNDKLTESLKNGTGATGGKTNATKLLTAEQAKANLATAEANKQTKLNAVLEESIAGSINARRVKIMQLTSDRNKLSDATEQERLEIKRLNAAIDEEQIAITASLDLDAQRQKNIGNYNGQLGVLGKALKGVGGLGIILSRTIGIDPLVFEGIREAGRAVRDLKHIKEGEELVSKEHVATTAAGTVALEANTAAENVNAEGTKAATLAQRLYNLVIGESTGLMKALRIALAASGIGVVLIGIGALVTLLSRASAAEHDLGKATESKAEQQERAARSQKIYNEVQQEAIKSTAQELVSIKELVSVAKNENDSRDIRQKAIDELQSKYPDYLKNITLETINSKAATEAIDELTQSILSKAVADEYAKRVAEAVIKQDDIKRKIAKEKKFEDENNAAFDKKLAEAKKNNDQSTINAMERYGRMNEVAKIKQHDYNVELEDSNKEIEDLTAGFDAATLAALKFSKKPPPKIKGDKADKTSEENAKAEFEIFKLEAERRADLDMEIVKNEKLSYSQRLEALNDYVNTKQKIIDKTAEFELSNTKLTGALVALVQAKQIDSTIRLAHSVSDMLKQTVADFSDSGRGLVRAAGSLQGEIDKKHKKEQEDFDKGQKEKEAAIKHTHDLEIKAAEEVFALVQSLGDAKFENEKNRIQKLIDANNRYASEETDRINNSTLSEQDKAAKLIQLKAETDQKNQEFAKKQKEQDIKKARFDKAFAIAKILETTAQAEVEALTYLSNPFTAPLYPGIAAIIATIGALQLAAAIATPIPTYAEGTQDHPGGLARYGEAGPEAVVLPGGKTFIADKDTTGYLPSHAKVIPLTVERVNEIMYGSVMANMSERMAIAERAERKETERDQKNTQAQTEQIVKAIKEMDNRPIVRTNIVINADFERWKQKYVNGNG